MSNVRCTRGEQKNEMGPISPQCPSVWLLPPFFGCSFGCSFGCCCQREGPPPPPASEWAARSRATAAPSERASGRRRSRRGVSAWHESTRNHSPAANPLLRETPSAGKRTDFAVSHSLAYAVAPLMSKRTVSRSSLSANWTVHKLSTSRLISTAFACQGSCLV